MQRFSSISIILAALLLAAGPAASRPSRADLVPQSAADRSGPLLSGAGAAKSDTVLIYGGPGTAEGKFHNPLAPSVADMQGWMGAGNGTNVGNHWQASDFHSPTGTPAAWCGDVYQPCSALDPVQGYGNGWNDAPIWEQAVADPDAATSLTVTWSASWETETGFDFLRLQYWRESLQDWASVVSRTGIGSEIQASVTFSVAAADLGGQDGDRVRLRILAQSDAAYSDADCDWPTAAGLCQVDDVSVSGTNGIVLTLDDFEDGFVSSAFQPADPENFSFVQAWPRLWSLDDCHHNTSPQLAFIDNGVPVPCTGGSLGTTWTYGPNGYVVAAEHPCLPTFFLRDAVWSPPIAWADAQGQLLPEDHTSALLEYDVYDHLPLAAGIVRTWSVRFQDRVTGIWSPWRSSDFVAYSDTPISHRVSVRLDPYVEVAPAAVQVGFGVMSLGIAFPPGDTTPAPYFDNVTLRVMASDGPMITTRGLELFQDAFPAHGLLDLSDLGSNDVRLDRAEDINGSAFPGIQPGDSITVTVLSAAPGGALTGPPVLHYVMQANPIFDAYRAHPTTGTVDGLAIGATDRYSFDLPDEDFFYPGDVIHYYIRAEESSSLGVRASTLPADLSGYGVFSGDPAPLAYPLQVRALPSLASASAHHQPEILLWRDAGVEAGLEEWNAALRNLGLEVGVDVDVYTTQSAGLGVGNGLGARATPAQLAGYATILHDAGSLDRFTLNVPDQAGDKSDDVGLLSAWLDGGGQLVTFGNKTATDLVENGGAAGAAFLSDRMGADYLGADLGMWIGGQRSPALVPDPFFFYHADGFYAHGGCGSGERFDAIQPGSGTAVYRWLDPTGGFIIFPYSAGLRRQHSGGEVISFPVGFASLWTRDANDHLGRGSLAGRTVLLGEILQNLGHVLPEGTGLDDQPQQLAFSAAPNPFNPEVELRFTAASASRAVVEIFDVRGAKVRTLLDGRVDAGPHLASWDGRDNRGAAQASGVYFARVKVGEEQRVEKLALVR